MIDEPELKLAQITIIQLYFSQLYEVTRNLGNRNRTTAYEWSEINGYLYIVLKRLKESTPDLALSI